MRAWELNEVIDQYNLTTHDKLWVNPDKKQIVDVPIEKHHTQFAFEHPEKFGLSGKLFKDSVYPMRTDKPDPYDKETAKVMFKAGWVRTNVDKNDANIHCLDLKQCHGALRVLRQRYNNIDSVYIDIGPALSATEDHYVLQNDEFGKGTLRTFMRTGKIVNPVP